MHTRRFRHPKSSSSGEVRRPRAVALGYDPERDEAPRVLASGQGWLAEEILNLARANGITIREDPVLAAALASVEVDQVIPPELYALAAEVLAYVYRLQERKNPKDLGDL